MDNWSNRHQNIMLNMSVSPLDFTMKTDMRSLCQCTKYKIPFYVNAVGSQTEIVLTNSLAFDKQIFVVNRLVCKKICNHFFLNDDGTIQGGICNNQRMYWQRIKTYTLTETLNIPLIYEAPIWTEIIFTKKGFKKKAILGKVATLTQCSRYYTCLRCPIAENVKAL
jgi:hypothetical protein